MQVFLVLHILCHVLINASDSVRTLVKHLFNFVVRCWSYHIKLKGTEIMLGDLYCHETVRCKAPSHFHRIKFQIVLPFILIMGIRMWMNLQENKVNQGRANASFNLKPFYLFCRHSHTSAWAGYWSVISCLW